MSEKAKQSASDLLQAIESNSSIVRDAANALTHRIVAFEEYLSKVPGRVETALRCEHPDIHEGTAYLVIAFQRQGKEWGLYYGTERPQLPGNFTLGALLSPRQPTEFKPLRDAPLKYKVAAISQLPDLLQAMIKTQSELADEIVRATSDFDAFASTIGVKVTTEGKK